MTPDTEQGFWEASFMTRHTVFADKLPDDERNIPRRARLDCWPEQYDADTFTERLRRLRQWWEESGYEVWDIKYEWIGIPE